MAAHSAVLEAPFCAEVARWRVSNPSGYSSAAIGEPLIGRAVREDPVALAEAAFLVAELLDARASFRAVGVCPTADLTFCELIQILHKILRVNLPRSCGEAA